MPPSDRNDPQAAADSGVLYIFRDAANREHLVNRLSDVPDQALETLRVWRGVQSELTTWETSDRHSLEGKARALIESVGHGVRSSPLGDASVPVLGGLALAAGMMLMATIRRRARWILRVALGGIVLAALVGGGAGLLKPGALGTSLGVPGSLDPAVLLERARRAGHAAEQNAREKHDVLEQLQGLGTRDR